MNKANKFNKSQINKFLAEELIREVKLREDFRYIISASIMDSAQTRAFARIAEKSNGILTRSRTEEWYGTAIRFKSDEDLQVAVELSENLKFKITDKKIHFEVSQ